MEQPVEACSSPECNQFANSPVVQAVEAVANVAGVPFTPTLEELAMILKLAQDVKSVINKHPALSSLFHTMLCWL